MQYSDIQNELKLYYSIDVDMDSILDTISKLKIMLNDEPDSEFIIFYYLQDKFPEMINSKTKSYIDRYIDENSKNEKMNELIVMYKAFMNLALNCDDYDIFCKKLDYADEFENEDEDEDDSEINDDFDDSEDEDFDDSENKDENSEDENNENENENENNNE